MDTERITDLELLEYLAGRLSRPRRAEVDALLASSPADRRRLDALRRTWDLMGRWEVDTARHGGSSTGADVLAGVLERVERPRGRWVPLSVPWRTAGRVAAAWVLAIGLGAGGGWLSLSRRPAQVPSPELEQEVAQLLHLDTVAGDGPAGLTQSLMDGPEDEEASQ